MFIYTTIYSGTLYGSAEANFCVSPLEILGCLDIKPVTLYVRGGGDANLAVIQYHAAGKLALSFKKFNIVVYSPKFLTFCSKWYIHCILYQLKKFSV